MSERDLYDVLGVSRDATQEDIRSAYRRLAREHHPDVNRDPEAERRFKEINLAYQTLSDPARRRQYDLFGGEGISPDLLGFGDLGDIVEAFFGGSPFGRARTRRRARTVRGSDLRVTLPLTFEEAVFGATKEVPLRSLRLCDRCQGTGCEPGTVPTRCSGCGGSGEVSDVRRSVFGTVMTSRTCGRCEGTGEEIASPCTTCRGDGRVPAERAVSVEVPAGVSDGMELRMEEAGEDGRAGGGPGDLYLGLDVDPHPVFERRGQDLVGVLEVPVLAAITGARIEVDTLDGPATVSVPPGTRAGTLLRVKEAGVPNLGRRGRGDLVLQVDLEVPRKLSREDRRQVEELAERRGERGPLRGRLRPLGR
jgi:molecular chaperone DnaJ